MEFTITFTHPDGAREGLRTIRAIERVLREEGCDPFDHGTNFDGSEDYESSDVTASGDAIPMRKVNEVLKEAGAERIKVVTRQRKTP